MYTRSLSWLLFARFRQSILGIENESRKPKEVEEVFSEIADMGLSLSKEGTSEEQLKRVADRVKACLNSHESNVHTFDHAIGAQNDSVELLIKRLSDLQQSGVCEREQSENGPMHTAQSLLSNIQKTLLHQCKSLNRSFEVLNACINEILHIYIPGSGSSAHSEEAFDTCTLHFEGERHSFPSDSHVSGTESKLGDIRTDLAASQAENKSLKQKLKESNDSVKKLQVESEHQRNENKRLQQSVSHKTDELKQLQNNYYKQNEEMDKKCRKLERENETQKVEIRNRKQEANARQSLEFKVRQTEEDKRRLQRRVDELQRRVDELENEKQRLKERKISVPVQLYYQRRDELMSSVVEELSAMLVTQMSVKNIQLDIQRCENSSNIQPEKPTLVLCINASRLGTDAAAAIEGVHRSGRTALLIFHHKGIHAIPNHPSERMLTSAEFKDLGGIFDLAFLSGKGIYPCNMNNVAVTAIEEFVRQNIAG